MDWVGAVTAGAAGLAAVFAGVNLYLSGRRELDKWTRETLVETIATFLDASFKHASACRSIYRLSPEADELDRLRRASLAAHDLENESLTRLRLLAPSAVVEAARKLIESEYYLSEPCFLSPAPEDTSDVLIQPVHRNRAQFIEAARSALGLREKAGTGAFDKNVNWRNLRILVEEAQKEDNESKSTTGGG
jgi:hypothetical protein